MFKLLAVTNRHLCREPILERVRRLAEGGADAIILREKDLPEEAYERLAVEAKNICSAFGTTCILHTYGAAAQRLGAEALHLPLPALRTYSPELRSSFCILGASCHSLDDVQEAARLGCTYVTLGHIFETNCKKGVPPRGLALLQQVCAESPVPVCAIGGIAAENLRDVQKAGASGACIMSGLLQCRDPAAVLLAMRNALETT